MDALLTGRVAQHGDTIQVSAELTNVEDNNEIWGEHYERKASDIMSLQKQIAGDIADKLRSKMSGTEKQRVTRQGTQNPEAYQLYVKGLYFWNKRTLDDLNTAISYFHQAIDKDPGYAMAYAGLSDTYGVLSDYGGDSSDLVPKADAAAAKALELDPTLARPHAGLGYNKMAYYRDFAGGEAEFRKAFELDPSDATSHQWFAEALAYMGGRAGESIDEANRAHQLDPLSPIIIFAQSEAYASDRQFDKAIEVLQKCVADNPGFGRAHMGLANAYWGLRQYPRTLEEFEMSAKLGRGDLMSGFGTAAATAFHSRGWPAAVHTAIESLETRHKSKAGFVYAYQIAKLYADLGDKDHAFEWLNTAYQDRDYLLIGLRTDFQFDSLRSDPRYAELVRKIGFPQ